MNLLGTILSATACALPIDVSYPPSSNIYDCDRHMKRLFHEDWKYFNELQAAFKNYSNGPLNRIERMEEIIRKYSPNTAEIIQTNVFKEQFVPISKIKSSGIFELYTVTDLDRPAQFRVQDLLLVYGYLSPKRFKKDLQSHLLAIINSWNKLGLFLEAAYGREDKQYMINAVRIIPQSEGFLEDGKLPQSLIVYEIVDCYVRNAVRKIFMETYQ